MILQPTPLCGPWSILIFGPRIKECRLLILDSSWKEVIDLYFCSGNERFNSTGIPGKNTSKLSFLLITLTASRVLYFSAKYWKMYTQWVKKAKLSLWTCEQLTTKTDFLVICFTTTFKVESLLYLEFHHTFAPYFFEWKSLCLNN